MTLTLLPSLYGSAKVTLGNISMTGTVNNLVRKQAKLRGFVATAGAWFQALDYTSSDYAQHRIDLLERKVAGLTEDLRKGLASSSRDSATL